MGPRVQRAFGGRPICLGVQGGGAAGNGLKGDWHLALKGYWRRRQPEGVNGICGEGRH